MNRRRYIVPIAGNGQSAAEPWADNVGPYRPKYVWDIWDGRYSLESETPSTWTVWVDVTETDHEWLISREGVVAL